MINLILTIFCDFFKFKRDLKFTEEGRFSFGVAVRKNANGEEEGVRLEVFDYTCTSLLTIGKYEALINQEISRVKALCTTGKKSQK